MILNMLFPSSAWKSSPSCSFFFLIFFSSLLNRVSITIKTPQHFSPFSLCLCNLHYNNCLLIKYLLDFKLLLGRGCVVCNWPSHRAQKPLSQHDIAFTVWSLPSKHVFSECEYSCSFWVQRLFMNLSAFIWMEFIFRHCHNSVWRWSSLLVSLALLMGSLSNGQFLHKAQPSCT